MLEVTIKQFLETRVNVPVYLEVPADAAKEYYAIERVGGSEDEKIFHSSVTIESVGKSLYSAALMDENLYNIMCDLPTMPDVSSINLNSHYNATDTERKQYKYKALFDINHY